jgi:voltage-gated potassium channel
VALGLYIFFLIVAFFDGSISKLTDGYTWWYSLSLPVTGLYSLLIIPLLRNRLIQAINAYRKIVPFNNRLSRLELSAYTLNERGEWLAIIVGTLVGWVIIVPPLQQEYFSYKVFDFLGDVLVFGTAGWHIFAALARTRLLSTIHDQVQSATVFEQSVSYRPILTWSVASVAAIVGGIIISTLFVPPGAWDRPQTLTIYGTLILSAILVFAFSRVPTSILSQFRVFRAFFMFVLVAVIGTVGFHRLENWSLQDSLYATIITMTTIGYGDYSPKTPEGQIFTIFLSLFAIGIGGYAITSLASFVIDGQFHQLLRGRLVDKKIIRMRNHYILCGAGKLGRQLAIEFYKSQFPFVVIEQESTVLEDLMREVDIPYVQGDATRDESLRLAGIERCKGLVSTLGDDKDNVFVVLSARSLNPNLRIISKVTLDKNRKKLEKAGADLIISPNAVSGRRMAAEMFNSEVVSLLDEILEAERQTGQTLRLEEVHVNEIKIPALVERLSQGELQIADIGQRTELMVVAVKRGKCEANQEPYLYNPRGNTRLQQDDVLIVVGTPEQRIKLQQNVLSTSSFETWFAKLWP